MVLQLCKFRLLGTFEVYSVLNQVQIMLIKLKPVSKTPKLSKSVDL